MTILILSVKDDPHADAVEAILRQRDKSVIRYDYTLFPATSELGINISDDQISGFLKIGEEQNALDDITGVLFRRPGRVGASKDVKEPFKTYINSEADAFLETLYDLTERACWVSIPQYIRDGEIKYRQLKLAKKLGFKIPDTVMGNHHGLANNCVERHPFLALKAVRNVVIEFDYTFLQKVQQFFYKATQCFRKKTTSKTPLPFQIRPIIPVITRCFKQSEAQPYIEQISACPVILQGYVPKKVELRITVVGQKIFPCAIYSQESSDKNQLDWRDNVFDCKHEIWPLPANVEQKCFDLVKGLGLQFGCIDVIVTPDDEYVFLEINPNGQWLWIQDLTGMPIAEALADLLTNSMNVLA